jgi:hypothetical protein
VANRVVTLSGGGPGSGVGHDDTILASRKMAGSKLRFDLYFLLAAHTVVVDRREFAHVRNRTKLDMSDDV